MIIKGKKQERLVEVEPVADVLCNKCGNSVVVSEYCDEGTRLQASFGYGSNKDGLDEFFHLCDDCYDWLVSNFLHEPTEI